MNINLANQKEIVIGLVQINNSFSGASYLPYTAGLLQSYVEQNLVTTRCKFLPFIYSRIPVQTAVEQLLEADIVGFSTYVWNFKLSLEIAKQLKKNKPEVTIVFGGPQVPDHRTESFLREHTFIDIACHGEGEQAFYSIINSYHLRNWAKVPSISFIDNKNYFVKNTKADRIKNLNIIPSPYLTGVFKPLIDQNSDVEWLALWETNRGCPFSCTFCDWGSATASKVYRFDLERLFKELDWFSSQKIVS